MKDPKIYKRIYNIIIRQPFCSYVLRYRETKNTVFLFILNVTPFIIHYHMHYMK